MQSPFIRLREWYQWNELQYERPAVEMTISNQHHQHDMFPSSVSSPLAYNGGRCVGRREFRRCVAPVLQLLRLCGFLPFSFRRKLAADDDDNGGSRRHKPGDVVACFYGRLATWAYVCITCGLFCFNLFWIYLAQRESGLLHVNTMMMILVGLKPAQCGLNLLIFAAGRRRHATMLQRMQTIDEHFVSDFHFTPPYRTYNIGVFTAAAIMAFAHFAGRLAEYMVADQQPLADFMSDASIGLVPMLTLWQMVPLFYFFYICRIHLAWFRHLKAVMKRDRNLAEYSVGHYYERFIELCSGLAQTGRFFNPFLFFSLAMCIVVLCLTIYFSANIELAINIEANATWKTMVLSYSFPMWALFQVVTAVAYVICFAVAGWKTNEKARSIVNAALAFTPTDDVGRFKVTCFVHKVQAQHTWGITVWKAFPVERILLFSLVGIISTYAVVLLRLQQKTDVGKMTNT